MRTAANAVLRHAMHWRGLLHRLADVGGARDSPAEAIRLIEGAGGDHPCVTLVVNVIVLVLMHLKRTSGSFQGKQQSVKQTSSLER